MPNLSDKNLAELVNFRLGLSADKLRKMGFDINPHADMPTFLSNDKAAKPRGRKKKEVEK